MSVAVSIPKTRDRQPGLSSAIGRLPDVFVFDVLVRGLDAMRLVLFFFVGAFFFVLRPVFFLALLVAMSAAPQGWVKGDPLESRIGVSSYRR